MKLSEPWFNSPIKIGGAPILTYMLAAVLTLSVGSTSYLYTSSMSLTATEPVQKVDLGSFPIIEPTILYGFAIDTFQLEEYEITSGEVLSDMLIAQGLSYTDIATLVQNMQGVFELNRLRAGKSYTILKKEGQERAQHLIYEPSVYEYYVFDLAADQLAVRKVERPVSTEIRTANGKINSSLWQAMTDYGLSYELTDKMEDALQWSVDFHHLQKGDVFKLVYEQHIVNGQEAGIGLVRAAYYKTGEKESRVVYYEDDNAEDEKRDGYYSPDGRPMAAGFLKSPVKYARISSYYNLNRLHPILKRRRPHYGTDYAAPYGTPILAVGSGTISKASYTKGNGYFVKMRHDDTFETQYLHMQKFAKGIKPGVKVSQGEVIGYVGATGLATGPHVCFRFWKNGKQVNHLQLNLPPAQPLPESEMEAFILQRDRYLPLIDKGDTYPPSETEKEKIGAP